ncbi:MAG: glycosyltransferase [Verrucomicrobia bacterium]|nr:glycosyltransferase [Verrucomicrobiota bacterium]
MPHPTFSVIIASRNPGPAIQHALQSVSEQSAVSVEVVVIDGNSDDGTIPWLLAQKSPDITVLCEPDHSAYEAMNKGTKLARGDWFVFLGADDRLASSDVLAQVQAQIGMTQQGILTGEAKYTDGRIWSAPYKPNIYYRNFLHHQASFYHRSLFDNMHFDESLRIQADYDFNLRLWLAGVRPKPLSIYIAQCNAGGISDRGDWDNYREEIQVRHRHLNTWRCLPWDSLSIARYLRKKMIRKTASARPE